MPRMSQLGRLSPMKDTRALKGGAAFEPDAELEPLPGMLEFAEPFGDTSEQDSRINLILSRIGGDGDDVNLAKQMIYYQDTEAPNATTPELMIFTMLRGLNRPFQFQVPYRGGRRVRGGIVIDFLVEQYGEWTATAVQGEYWHSDAESNDRDRNARSLVMGAVIDGLTVGSYVEAWDGDLYTDREGVMQSILAGRNYRS